jgi:sugar/nucleoside kinase (ribokinase family)
MAVGQAIAERAKAQGIPVVVDAGSWKPGFEQVLAQTDYAICSANFRPPTSCETKSCETDILNYLQALGVPRIAITNGEQPITWLSQSKAGTIETGKLAVPQINPVDTVGAGDVFHGAFCHFILQMCFQEALSQAAKIAARACESFGTRKWMQ